MFLSLCFRALRWILQLAALRVRSDEFKDLEIVVLRHELAILRRRIRRPPMTWTDRIFLTAASRLLSRAQWRSFMVCLPESQSVRQSAHRYAAIEGSTLTSWRTSSRL